MKYLRLTIFSTFFLILLGFFNYAHGATEFISIVDPGNGPDTDYTSLSAFEAGNQTNLTVATTQVFSGTKTGTIANNTTVYLCTSGGSYRSESATVVHATNGQILVETITGAVAEIATNVWYTNNTCNSADYFTLSDEGDSAIAVAECRSTDRIADTTAVTISGWGTSYANHIKFRGDADGKWNEENYRLEPASGTAIYINGTTFLFIEELQIYPHSGSGITHYSDSYLSYHDYIYRSIIRGNGSNYAMTTPYGSQNEVHSFTLASNVIYDFGTALSYGNNTHGEAIYNYNNTIVDCAAGIVTASATYNKNNLIDATDAFNGPGDSDTYNNYNSISENTADVAIGTNGRYNQTFTYRDEANDDFHLDPTDQGAKNYGTSGLSGASPDIDNETRQGSWEIGADEVVDPIYRSVAPGATSALASGTSNHLNISGSTATFDSALPDNIGIGDALQYDDDNDGDIDASDSIAFIYTRIDSTHFRLLTSSGGAPTVPSGSDEVHWDIFRSYTSLSDAESGTENTGIDSDLRDFDAGNINLTTNNTNWFFACYANGTTADSTSVTFDGWTTSATNYVKIYTPTDTDEVGATQRHQGVWSTNYYRLDVSSGTALTVSDNFISIEGLQFSSGDSKVLSFENPGTAGEKVSGNIIKGAGEVSDYLSSYFYNIDLNTEADYTQEDSSKTKFTSGKVKLSGDGIAFETIGSQTATINANGVPTDMNPDETRTITSGGAVSKAVVTQEVLSGDFDFSFTLSAFGGDQGYVGVAPINATTDVWLTDTLVEFCKYAAWPNYLTRKWYGGYTYVTTTVGPHTFRIWRSGSSIYASIDGSYTSVLYTNSSDIRFGIYYAYDSIGTQVTETLTSWSASVGNIYSTTPYYVTTSDDSQIDTSSYQDITSVTLTQTTPTNTSLKYLVSFDDRSTWKYWDGDSWETSALADLQTNGMEKTALEGLTEANWETTGGFSAGVTTTLDFALDLQTNDDSVTPDLDNIKVNYESYAYHGIYLGETGSSSTAKIWNNIIYDYSGTGSSGIYWYDPDWTMYIYNNTIKDSSVGLYRVDDTAQYMKNNLIDATDAFLGTFTDDDDHNDYNAISENTDDPSIGSHGRYNKTFLYNNSSGDDFHLDPEDVEARDNGADLTFDDFLNFNTDIDSHESGTDYDTRAYRSSWDIGADELSGAEIYRSVGPGVSAVLATGASNHLNISLSTATFDSALPDNVGVGDVLEYDSDNDGDIDASDSIAFIHGRTSETVFTIKTSKGGNPDVPSAADEIHWNINRAYSSLFDWEWGNENTLIDPDLRDFDAGNEDIAIISEQWNIACYANGTTADSASVVVDGWTTSETGYIKIFTPDSSSEVGISQRHSGKWDERKYHLEMAGSATGIFKTSEDYVEIEGLQFRISSVGGNNEPAIYFSGTSGLYFDFKVSNNIIRGSTDVAGDYQTGIKIDSQSGEGTEKIYNNIIYDFRKKGSASDGVGIYLNDDESTAYAYNNTVYNADWGYLSSTGTFLAKNNIAQNCTDGFSGTFSASSDYNVSDFPDVGFTDAPGTNSKDARKVIFASEENDDFRLSEKDAEAKDFGTDLSADAYLPFSDDIEKQNRIGSWDAGADETAVQIYRSVGPGATTALASGTSNHLNISSSTAAFDTGLSDNIGVGDALQYDDDNDGDIDASDSIVFITERISATIYTIKTASGGAPTIPSAADEIHWNIFRAYSSLSDAESGTENSGIDSDLVDFDSGNRDLVANNEQWNIAAYANGTTADTTAVTINGWTTGPQNFINIFTPSLTSEVGTSQRHKGKWDANKYHIQVSSGEIVYIRDEYVSLDGIQIDGNSGASSGIRWNTDARGETQISNAIIKGVSGIGINDDYAFFGNVVKIWNSLIYDCSGVTDRAYVPTVGTHYAYNLTLVDNHDGVRLGGADFHGINILSRATNLSFSVSSGTMDLSYSASDDDTANDWGGTDNRVNQTFTFKSESDDDFHLGMEDTGAMSHGTNLSDDYDLPFSDDIDGAPRSGEGSWDIGADEALEAKISFSQTDKERGNLAGMWSFDGNDISGSRILDRSGNNNDGIMANNSSILDFDASDESLYVQESDAGTSFLNGKVYVYRTDQTVSGGTITASSELSSSYYDHYAFNNTLATGWIANASTGWLKYDFGVGSPKIIDWYSISAISTTSYVHTAKSWTFEGSNNNVDWTVLDTRDETAAFAQSEKREYSFSNGDNYRYYRINITSTFGTYAGIGEMEMAGENYVTTQPYYATTSNSVKLDTLRMDHISGMAINQTTPASTSIKYLLSFDGRSTWKYWNGSSWTASSLADLQTDGMSKATLEGITQAQWESSGGFSSGATAAIDVAADLSTSDATVTPELDSIQVNFFQSPSLVSNVNFNAEADYTQEDGSDGTYFSGGKVSLVEQDILGNLCIGGTATASSVWSGREASRAFDGLNTSYGTDAWEGVGAVSWLKYDFGIGNEKIVGSYKISATGPTDSAFADSPGQWTFEGSNNDSDWTILDSQNEPAWTALEERSYNFSNQTPYRYYRINVTALAPGWISDYLIIGEMEMFDGSPTGIYPISQAYYATTTDSSQVDVSEYPHITKAETIQETPASTSIKYLVSFDDRVTWKYWDGNSWETSSLANLQTEGMSKAELESITESGWETSGGFDPSSTSTLDFAVDLDSDEKTNNPELDNIKVSYFKSSSISNAVDFTTEADYTQENSTYTDFSEGKAYLTDSGPIAGADQCTGGTATASSAWGDRPAADAFDDLNTDRDVDAWMSNTTPTPFWLQYDFGSGNNKVIREYSIAASSSTSLIYAPQDWTFQGSNDASGWITLDTRSGETGWTDFEERNYSFYNTTAYRYYRITITLASSYAAIGEMEMFSDPTYSTSQPYYITTSDSSQLDVSDLPHITKVEITQETPASTSLKYLVSFDDRVTWKYWNGSSWTASSLANLQTDGMSKATLEGITQAQWESSGGFDPNSTSTFDFAVDISSSDSTTTPEVDIIRVNYYASEEDSTLSLGKRGQAMNLNGTSDYVRISQNSNMPIYSEVQYSLSMWVKGEANQADKKVFAEASTSDADPVFSVGTASGGDSGKADVYVRDNSGTVRLNHVQSTGTVFDGNWHHIVWTDNNGTAKLYIDGTEDVTDFSYTRDTTTFDRTAIGALIANGASNYFDGMVDEVRAYDKVLSADEVGRLYRLGDQLSNVSQAQQYTNSTVLIQPFDGKYMDWTQASAEARDQSGNANHGDVSGATAAIGKIGQALSFDGNSYINLGNNSSLDITGSMTISLWIYRNNNSGYVGFIDKDASTSYFLGGGDGANDISFWLNNTEIINTGDNQLKENTWHHLLVTFDDGTDAVAMYLDGSSVATGTFAGTITGNSSNVYLGRKAYGYERYFNGRLDEFRIYNRVLSADEINGLFRLGSVQYVQ